MRALLIEYDSVMTKSIEKMLRHVDVCVDATDSAEDGIGLCRRYDYDVVILDLRPPGIGVFDAIRALRMAQIDTPILVLSGAAMMENQVKALNAGADGYMTKPFHKDEFVARVKALVRRSRGHSDSAITTGQVTVNLAEQSVAVGGVPLHLTDMEYRILELLSLRRGVTLNKDVFIDHLYANGEGPESRTIELFVCNLRKKLATATGGDRCIETIRRGGYLLRAAA